VKPDGTSALRIECASAVDAVEWDRLAVELGGSFFHSRAFALHEARHAHTRPLFVKVRDGAGRVMALAVATLGCPKLWPLSTYSRTATLGALPAPSIAGIQRTVLSVLERELGGQGVYTIGVQAYDSEHSKDVLSSSSYSLVERVEFYLDLTPPLEEIAARLKGARRTDIRKAEKLGVETRLERGASSCAILRQMQASSMARRGIPSEGTEEHREDELRARLLEQDRAILLVSHHGGQAVNAAMFGVFGERAYYLYSGSSLEGNRCAGPVHLLWTAARILRERGVRTLNLGGVASPTDEKMNGLLRFKQGFGAEMVSQPSGTKVLSVVGSTLATGFERAKRWIGR